MQEEEQISFQRKSHRFFWQIGHLGPGIYIFFLSEMKIKTKKKVCKRGLDQDLKIVLNSLKMGQIHIETD